MKSIRSDLANQILQAVKTKIKTDPGKIKEKHVSPGEQIIDQDGTPKELFFIIKGKVKISHTTLKGYEYLMAVAGPGEFVGEVEILTHENHLCSVTALESCCLGMLNKKAYQTWLADDSNFSLLVNQAICFRLQKISARAAMHLTYPLEYSVLKFIKDEVTLNPDRFVTISRNELAHYLGTSKRSINRILKTLQEQDILRVDGHRIFVQ